MNDLLKRLPTTVILVVFVFTVVRFFPPVIFSALLYLILCLAAWEFMALAAPHTGSVWLLWINGAIVAAAFTFSPASLVWALLLSLFNSGIYFLLFIRRQEQLSSFPRDMGVQLLGILYIYLPVYFLYVLKKNDPNLVLFLVAVIAVGDSGAYFVGRALGKRHIYPIASPKKTLEGLVAALVTAGLAGWVFNLIFPVTLLLWKAVGIGIVIELFSQLSDPVESLFKRAAGKKDSGVLLPGHGGVLDRIDSYIFCAPLLAFLVRWL